MSAKLAIAAGTILVVGAAGAAVYALRPRPPVRVDLLDVCSDAVEPLPLGRPPQVEVLGYFGLTPLPSDGAERPLAPCEQRGGVEHCILHFYPVYELEHGGIEVRVGVEGAANQLKPLPETFLPGDLIPHAADGSVIGAGALVRMTAERHGDAERGCRLEVRELAASDEPPPHDLASVLGRLCKEDDAAACSEYATAYYHGTEPVRQDQPRALELYLRACELGRLRACAYAGGMYADGIGTERDLEKAVAIYRRGCGAARRNVEACNDLAVHFLSGDGVEVDRERARELFTFACKGGNVLGCSNLADMYVQDEDPTRAYGLYERACGSGQTYSCLQLADMDAEGIGVPQNRDKAIQRLRSLCEAEQYDGCNALGILHLDDDDSAAAALFDRACRGGLEHACGNLGLLYKDGQGVERDDTRAAELLRDACERGRAVSCNALGVMFDDSRGGTPAEALALYQKACDLTPEWGCNNLGIRYEDGIGVARDPEKAKALYQRACDAGVEVACQNLAAM